MQSQTSIRAISQQELYHLAYQCAPPGKHTAVVDFIAAWTTIHQYDITHAALTNNGTSTQMLADWVKRTQLALPSDLIAEESVPDHLVQLNFLPEKHLLLDHIEQLTKPQQRYLVHTAGGNREHNPVLVEINYRFSPACNKLEHSTPQMGLREIRESTARPNAKVRPPHGYTHLREEIKAAANWAYDVKRADTQAKVGIVVPNLAANYELVQHHTAAFLDSTNGSLTTTFDLSSGLALGLNPAWQHAKTFLENVLFGDHPGKAGPIR